MVTNFDIDKYFASRTDVDTKLQSVIDASREKITELRAYSDNAIQHNAERAAIEEASKNSWARKLGLTPGGFASNAVNLGASVAAGTSRVAGQLAALPVSAVDQLAYSPVTQADTDAYNRLQTGQAQPGDSELLNQRTAYSPKTIFEHIRDSSNARDTALDINKTFDLSSIVEQKNRKAFTDSLAQSYEKDMGQITTGREAWNKGETGKAVANISNGLAGLIVNAFSAVGSNPMGVLEHVMENVPQLMIGAVPKVGMTLLTASNIGYATDTFQQGMQDRIKANKGQIPSLQDQKIMAMQAVALVAAEQFGDVVSLGAMKAVGKDAIRTGFKESILNVGKAGVKGTVTEAPTETVQTYLEGQIKDKPATGVELYTAGVIGGATGGTLTGGGRSIAELLKATPEHVQARKADTELLIKDTAAQQTAIETGDVTNRPTIAAIAALAGNSQKPETDAINRQQNLDKATNILNELQDRRASIASVLETPAEKQAKIADLEARMAASTNPDHKAVYADAIALANLPVTPAQVKAAAKDLAKLDKEIADITPHMDNLASLVKGKQDIPALVASVAFSIRPPVETDTQETKDGLAADVARRATSAETVIRLAMTSLNDFTDEQLTQLSDNASGALTGAQVAQVRLMSASKIAQNRKVGEIGVSKDILIGSPKDSGRTNKGIADYRNNISAAFSTNNQIKAESELAGLDKFERDHRGKAVAAADALTLGVKLAKEGVEVKGGIQIQRTVDGKWIVNPNNIPKLTGETRAKSGAFTVYLNNGQKKVDLFTLEADALTAAATELRAAIALKFNKIYTQPVVNNVGGTNANVSGTSTIVGTDQPSTALPVSQATTAGRVSVPADASLGSIGGTADIATTGTTEQPAALTVKTTGEADVKTEETKAEKPITASTGQQEVSTTPTVDNINLKEKQNVSQEKTNADANAATKEEVKAKVEESVPVTAPVVEPEEVSQQGLAALSKENKTPEGTAYELRHYLSEFFKQSLGKENDASNRPLVAVKDFLSTLKNDVTGAVDYLANKTLSAKQQAALEAFRNTALGWFNQVKVNLPKRESDAFRSANMIQYLLTGNDENLNIEENVKTAIAYAVYSTIVDLAGKPQNLTNEAINSILHRSGDKWVSYNARIALGKVGLAQDVFIDSLGGIIIELLGLKAIPDAGQDLMAKLRTSLGAQAMQLAEDKGLVTRNLVTGFIMRDLQEAGLTETQLEYLHKSNTENNVPTPTNRTIHTFFSISRDGKTEAVVPTVQAIADTTKDTGSVLDKLFGIESGVTLPSLEKITKVQQSISGTDRKIPAEQQKVILANQANERIVRKDTLKLFEGFEEYELHSMFGVKNDGDTEENKVTTHVVNRAATKAKNDGLKREYTLFVEYINEYLTPSEKGLDTPFFLPYTVWKNQRVGVGSTVVNPQSSKIIRHLIASPKWTTTIALNNPEQLDSFFLRVAEGLKIKTEKSDSQSSVAVVKAMMSDEVLPYANAIESLHKSIVKGEVLTRAEREYIVEAVSKGGANVHTLDALIAMAYYTEAYSKGEDSTFTVQLTGEVDGVANGTMLNHILLGAHSTIEELNALLNMGGIYQRGSDYAEYNEYRGTTGNLDIYESIGRKVYDDVVWNDPGSAELNAIWAISGKMFDPLTETVTDDGRGLIKGAMNPLGFGSSIDSIIDGMGDTFIENIYKGLEKLSASNASQNQVDTFITHLNTLVGKTDKPTPMGTPISVLMEHPLTYKSEIAIRKVFTHKVAYITGGILEDTFTVFIARRDKLNDLAKASSALYQAVYNGEREAFIEELLAQGKMPTRKQTAGKEIGKLLRLRDLSQKEETELAKRVQAMLPVLNTAMSASDNGISTGYLMLDKDRKFNQNSLYATRAKIGHTLLTTKPAAEVAGKSTQIITLGLGAGSAATHSSDSAIVNGVQTEGIVTTSMHDALLAGINILPSAAASLNKHTWKVMLAYSPLEELYVSLARIAQGIAFNIENGTLSAQTQRNLLAYFKSNAWKLGSNKKDGSDYIQLLLDSAKQSAYAANKMKYGAMATWATVDQYAFQGSSYEVTAADTKEAEALLTKTEEAGLTLSDADNAAITSISKLFGSYKTNRTTTVTATEDTSVGVQDVIELIGEIPSVSTFTDNFWGLLGKPTQISDPSLKAFLETPGDKTIGSVLAQLKKQIPIGGMTNNFRHMLIKQFMKLPNVNRPVHYITKNTESSITTAKDSANNATDAGWYYPPDDSIFILSEDFVGSNINPELMLHEITHAALTYLVNNPTASTKVLINSLTTLMKAAEKFAKENGGALFKRHESAFTNIDEFIAYGLTRQSFGREVLNSMPPVEGITSNTRNSLVSGMKAFIQGIVGILFQDRAISLSTKEQLETNMGIFLSNVSSLLSQAEQGTTNKITNSTSFLKFPMTSPAAIVNTYSTTDIYSALASATNALTPSFDAHLKEILGGIVFQLHGAFGSFKESLMQYQAGTPMDVWLKSINTGVAPFSSSTLNAGFDISEQEAFVMSQIEVTVKTAMNSEETAAKFAYKELSKLYIETSQRVKPTDFLSTMGPHSQSELARAQSLYDFIFDIRKNNGDKSDYLARFAALGMAHQGFNKILQVSTNINTKRARNVKSLAEKLQIIFENILEFFQAKVTHTYQGMRADTKLTTLISQLVDIESKSRYDLAKKLAAKDYMAPVNEVTKKTVEKLKGTFAAAAKSAFIVNNRSKFIQGVGSLVVTVAEDRVDQFADTLMTLRDRTFQERQGILAGLASDIRGVSVKFQTLLRGSKNNEKNRLAVITNASINVLGAFADSGKPMTKEVKSSITKVFIDTGAHVLLDSMTLVEIQALLDDPAALNKAILGFEDQLTVYGPKIKAGYINQANYLADHIVIGSSQAAFQILNSTVISKLYGSPYQNQISKTDAARAQPIIQTLVALYALGYTNSTLIKQAKEILRTENARKPEKNQTTAANGVEFVMKLHKQLEADSKNKLFDGKDELMLHGYRPQIYNPHKEIKAANEKDGLALIAAGWEKQGVAPRDPADPGPLMHLYTLSDGGMQTYLSAIIGMKGEGARGAKLHSGYMNTNNATGLANAQMQAAMTKSRQADIARMAIPGPLQDLSKGTRRNRMIPLLNESGVVVNWRYMALNSTKDDLLDRDSSIETVLGVLAGSIYDKETVGEQNRNAIVALKEQYDADYKLHPDSYALVGPKSPDPELREIWKMLPDDAKKDAMDIWSIEGMWVRRDLQDIMFGYRKQSLVNLFKIDSKTLTNPVEKLAVEMFVGMARVLFKEKAELFVTIGERAWLEIVREMKDIIVVKSSMVTIGNSLSNLSLLLLAGVPITDMIKHHLIALRGATAYLRDSTELARLKTLQSTNYTQGNKQQIDKEILILEDAISRNPVTKLVLSGLMPTIAEDLSADTDASSFKAALGRKTIGLTSKLNPVIRDIGKTIYMTHDTKLYQVMSRAAQLSDFVSRYALYQHLVSRKDNPLSETTAIQEASDYFVNYDVPMQRDVQYLDDTGIIMFTKYFLRIQRVLVKTLKEQPLRVISMNLLDNFYYMNDIVLRSNALPRLGNDPFRSGAFGIFGVLDKLPTIAAGMSIIKGMSPVP